jgi:UDP-N-acetylglucosamine--dolichyl-phosphate N-acetylglucosaminephosphotransferase
MDLVLLAGIVLTSFFVTYYIIPHWIKKAHAQGITGKDMNKPDKPDIAEMGGICVIFGFVTAILLYVGLKTFYYGNNGFVPILACLCTILLITLIGVIDDILGWRKGLAQWQKPLLTIPAAMPMMAINAGHSTMTLPLLGTIDWGILYPLMIVPLGIMVAANGYNMLGGYNGLEAGMGVIILSVLGFVAFLGDNAIATVLAFGMAGALLAFLLFNWYPAQIFPGDTLTYSVGALIACVAVLGNLQKIAVLLFIPYVLDFFLPLRARFGVRAQAKPNPDGSLELPYDKIYDTTHLAIAVLKKVKRKVYEQDVVLFVYGLELVLVGIVAVMYL